MKQRELSCCSFRTEGKPAAQGLMLLQEGSKKLDKWTSFSCRDYCRRRVLMKEILCFCIIEGGEIPNLCIYLCQRGDKFLHI